ncbi:serine/threonine-protein kinase [Massilia sp. W12]|uniref:serine/threonine protein kinase n=1 Tax=Massilia sp. W12 TaxID=3126507 RepID=UPI0030CD0060
MNQLGKYQIRRELGKGAMGIVYEAFDPVIERRVALKTILREDKDEAALAEALARFKREAQAAGRLNHPGVVAVYDYGEAQSADAQGKPCQVAYIAMEYVDGRELRAMFEEQQRFTPQQVAILMLDILDALGHAHAHGVIHRDMKPGNLFVQQDGKVKIGDFGIARLESSDLTQVGAIIGTPAYMSPEQVTGSPVDARSDLFSCGVILYQLLTGERPFTGNHTSIMYKVLNEMPPPVTALHAGLPPVWDAVVKKAIAKNPDHRFQSAQEFAAAIKIAASGRLPEADDDKTVLHNPVAAQLSAEMPTQTFPARQAHTPSATPAPAPAPAAAAAPPANAAPGVTQAPLQATLNQNRQSANKGVWLGAAAAGIVAVAGAAYFFVLPDKNAQTPQQAAASASAHSTPAPQVAQTSAPQPALASTEIKTADGEVVISALGLVDPQDPKFGGDSGAAQAEVRADARRQLVEKALALYVDNNSLDKNYPVIEQKLLSRHSDFIKNVLHESGAETGKNGLLQSEARAVLKVRELRKSLNELSKAERIDFIRNNGDPKIAIQMSIGNADQTLPPARSQLAENVLKERVKSFGFRIWAGDGEVKGGPNAKSADFQIIGEAKFKQLSHKLPASGLTINKTVLTSWTVKAIDKATNEEIYLNTMLPKGASWNSEDQALADIGKQMGDEFSKDFFLQHFEYGVKKINLNIAGLPNAQTAQIMLSELRNVRRVLDVQSGTGLGQFQLQVPESSNSDLLQENLIAPLNAKLGQHCFALAGASGNDINLSFAAQCNTAQLLAKLESGAPAAVMHAPGARGKLKGKIST